MSDIVNPSYETSLKKLQQIYQQAITNKDNLVANQPDISKIYLDPNWLQNVATIYDSGDQPFTAIGQGLLVRDTVGYSNGFFSSSTNVTGGLMPVVGNFSAIASLPNITKDIIPYLEIRQSFTSTSKTVAGYVQTGIDFWVTTFECDDGKDGVIWQGIDPPVGNAIVISQFQVDNNFATFTMPAWHISWHSDHGGIYGTNINNISGAILLSVYDETNNVWIPIDENLVSNLNPSGQYALYIWSEAYQLNFALQWQYLSQVVVTREKDGYVALWDDPALVTPQIPFYFYEAVLSGGVIDFYVFPPSINDPHNAYNPVTVTLDIVKYSDVIGHTLTSFTGARQTNDPFFFRTSQSTDAKEIWEAHLAAGVVCVTDAVSTPFKYVKYNDTYVWTAQSGGGFAWIRTANHTDATVDEYYAPNVDLTSRVVVTCRPPQNWKQTTKFQK